MFLYLDRARSGRKIPVTIVAASIIMIEDLGDGSSQVTLMSGSCIRVSAEYSDLQDEWLVALHQGVEDVVNTTSRTVREALD